MLDYVDQYTTAEQREARLKATCLLGAHLLSDVFVRNVVLYWLDNYSNYTDVEREEDMFNEMIHQLLVRRPALKIHVGSGMIHRSCNTFVYPSYIQLLGNGKHCVPAEYFERRYQISFMNALSQLVEPHAQAFTQRVPDGLGGALALEGFVHDSVLEYFYEPSFVVITAYMFHLSTLISLTGGRELCDWLPRHYYSLRAIDEAALAEANCLGDTGRMEACRAELRQLYDALHTSDLRHALQQVRLMWEAKASYCWSQIFVRIASLCCPAPARELGQHYV
jgi:hypothetical protein